MATVLPDKPTKKGQRGTLRFPDGGSLEYEIRDEIHRTQSDNENKFFCLQRIVFDNGREELRLGYYIIGKKERMKGKWVWGQYCPLIPKADFEALIVEAKKKGWLGVC